MENSICSSTVNGELKPMTNAVISKFLLSPSVTEKKRGAYLPFKSLIDELVVSTGAMNERQAAEYYEKTSAGIVETGVADGSLLQVLPTYFTDQLQIQFNRETSGTAIVSLHNNAGAVVFEREYNVDRLPRLIIAGFRRPATRDLYLAHYQWRLGREPQTFQTIGCFYRFTIQGCSE